MQKATLVHFLQHFIVNNYLLTALQPPVVVLSWPSFHNLITAIRSQFTFNFLRESRGLGRTDAFSTLPATTYFMLIIRHSSSTHDSPAVLLNYIIIIERIHPVGFHYHFHRYNFNIAASSLFPLSREHISSFVKLIIDLLILAWNTGTDVQLRQYSWYA